VLFFAKNRLALFPRQVHPSIANLKEDGDYGITISEHQQWLAAFYQQHNWYQYSPFVRLNFLTEEVDEVVRAIRAKKLAGIIREKQKPR